MKNNNETQRHPALEQNHNSTGNMRWYKTYNSGSNRNDEAQDIEVTENNLIYVSGRSLGSDTVYLTVAYEEWERSDSAVYDTSGNPRYIKNQFIARFSKNILKKDAINDKGLLYEKPDKFIEEDALELLTEKAPFDLLKSKMIKIFPELTTNDTLTISRTGDTIRIPDFYSSFLIVANGNIDAQEACDSFNHCFPLVKYAHKNYLGKLMGNPPDDPLYQGNFQQGLFDTITNIGGVNVEGAWEIETGKPFVRVGVVDAAIDGRHKDLGGTSSSFLPGKVQGWDYEHDIDLQTYQLTQNFSSYSHHGTEMGGIIGAIRNNSLGIAGIAGGDWNDEFNSGVSLYSIRALDEGADTPLVSTALIARSIYISSLFPDSINGVYKKFGLDVINNSYGFYGDLVPASNPPTKPNPKYRIWLLRDAVHAVNRVGAIFVAARGNMGSYVSSFPSCYKNSWVLNVAGSGASGRLDSRSDYSNGVDLLAPYDASLTTTIDYIAGLDTSIYTSGSGTSSACAYVTGAASLLLSHLDNPNSHVDPNNMVQEDVEYILERTVSLLPVPYNDTDQVGFGRLNVGAALNLVHKPERRIIHISNDSANSLFSNIETIDTGLTMKLTEPLTFFYAPYNYHDTISTTEFDTGFYKVDVYKYSELVKHYLLSGDSIIFSWPIHNISTTYQFYEVDTYGVKYLLPYEHAYLDTVNKDSALLSGYFYKVRDIHNDTFIRWLPNNIFINKPYLRYSLLINNNTLNSINNSGQSIQASLYPNPAFESTRLNIISSGKEKIVVNLFDVAGRFIKVIFNGEIIEQKTIPIGIKNLANGIYIVSIQSTSGKRSLLLSKSE